MATEIRVPALGESVTEATVAKWLKKLGEPVAVDDPVVELETDKVTLEVNSTAAGVLSEIRVPEGANVNVGGVLGTIDGAGKAAAAPAAAPKPAAKPAPPASSALDRSGPAARKLAAESGLAAEQIAGTGKDGRVTKADVMTALERGTPAPVPAAPAPAARPPRQIGPREERVRMTRLRKRIAERLK